MQVGTEQMAVVDRMDQGPQVRFQPSLPLFVLVSTMFVKSIRIVEVAVHKRLHPLLHFKERGATGLNKFAATMHLQSQGDV